MVNILQSEFLKYKRTFTRKLIFLAPLFFILIALPQKLFMPSYYFRQWQLVLSLIFNWWPVIFVPIGMALFATLTAAQEKKAGNYIGIRTHNVSPKRIWIGKIIVMSLHYLFTTLILITAVIISGLITAQGRIPWSMIFSSGFTVWLVSLAIIPLQLWAATWKGTFASMAMGLIGLIIGIIASQTKYWIYIPWSWSTRLMSPIIGVHPNGTLLESSSPLLNTSVIPIGIVISVVAFVVITFITSIWFNRREVKCDVIY